MEYWEKGKLVWFDASFGYFIPGEIVDRLSPKCLVVQSDYFGLNQLFEVKSNESVLPRSSDSLVDIDDMICLNELNEASMLWNLKLRYEKNLIYTYTGSILIAVNPYKMFDIYNLDMVKKYENSLAIGSMPPHLFAIGSLAYSKMIKDHNDQVIIISGESGAGKTESTKLLMQYLAAVNRAPSNMITEQILEANPLLESFGNAKTTRNDNSSRFGKYLEVYFKDGLIIGAKISEYLLEKSRIVSQASDERNYHIFYELMDGLSDDQKKKYGLLDASKYFYLNQGGSSKIEAKDDAENFRTLTSAMDILGFGKPETDTIFKMLASVLHIGNIYFLYSRHKDQDCVEIGSDAEIKWACFLLGINESDLKQNLTHKITETRDEKLLTPFNLEQALDARDAIAKSIYSRLFTWLVQRVNSIISVNVDKQDSSIAILDIFGFENFASNGFEQLCINFANETLQFFFNKYIFKIEQEEYAREKIVWRTIEYIDNKPCIDLIAKKPSGIIYILDDESHFPRATDNSLVEKMHFIHNSNPLYGKPRMLSPEFSIKHYAGEVIYDVKSFLDKNRDFLRNDVIEMFINSQNQLLSNMFREMRDNYGNNRETSKKGGRYVTLKPITPTVVAKFHESLKSLLNAMSK